eukprot:scaffold155_cov347-Pavlova_lutheri.AAC.80
MSREEAILVSLLGLHSPALPPMILSSFLSTKFECYCFHSLTMESSSLLLPSSLVGAGECRWVPRIGVALSFVWGWDPVCDPPCKPWSAPGFDWGYFLVSIGGVFWYRLGGVWVSRAEAMVRSMADASAQLDAETFDPAAFVNEVFPTESSLGDVDDIVEKVRRRIKDVDGEIRASVRLQSSAGLRAREDLGSGQHAIQELGEKVKEIKQKSEQSERMVQEICRDIKKLDNAKKHLTLTITTLRRLAMLVSAVEQLQGMADRREYRDAASLLEAVNQLVAFFEPFSSVPRVEELRNTHKNIKTQLRSYIQHDFSTLAVQASPENDAEYQREKGVLSDACLVVDALEPQVKEEIVSSICNRELGSYAQIFAGSAEVSRLDKIDRRYAWLKRQLKLRESMWDVFPSSWKVPQIVCATFCKITRVQLAETLDARKGEADVATLLTALQRTIEFENEMMERFSPVTTSRRSDVDFVDASLSDAMRKKYSLDDQSHTSKESEYVEDAAEAVSHVRFRGAISGVFESHLQCYVDLEESSLMDVLDGLLKEETWKSADEDNKVLMSSMELFLHMKRSLKRCSALTRNQTLFSLFGSFQKILLSYAKRLEDKLPRPPAGMNAVPSSDRYDWQLRISEEEVETICNIVNTGEYCLETTTSLGENLTKILEEPFSESVDISPQEDAFKDVITRSLNVLMLAIATKMESALVAMTKKNWAGLDSVGDQSEYVGALQDMLIKSGQAIGGFLSPVNFQYFCEKLVASFVPRIYSTVLQCKRLGETGAQQLQVDLHAIQAYMLELPTTGGLDKVDASFSKYVSQEMGKSEAILKIVLSPPHSLAETFSTLLPGANVLDFGRILELKGIKRQEQQELVDLLSGEKTLRETQESPAEVDSSNSTKTSEVVGKAVAAMHRSRGSFRTHAEDFSLKIGDRLRRAASESKRFFH